MAQCQGVVHLLLLPALLAAVGDEEGTADVLGRRLIEILALLVDGWMLRRMCDGKRSRTARAKAFFCGSQTLQLANHRRSVSDQGNDYW